MNIKYLRLGSSFQWFMGAIGGSTRANRPNRRCRGGGFLVTLLCGITGKKHGLIRARALNRANTVLLFFTFLEEEKNPFNLSIL